MLYYNIRKSTRFITDSLSKENVLVNYTTILCSPIDIILDHSEMHFLQAIGIIGELQIQLGKIIF